MRHLAGPIRSGLGDGLRLESLDLSYNHFSGAVPSTLGRAGGTLARLNVSYNDLSGPLPPDSATTNFSRFGSSAFLGNPGLCAGFLLLQQCRPGGTGSHTRLVIRPELHAPIPSIHRSCRPACVHQVLTS